MDLLEIADGRPDAQLLQNIYRDVRAAMEDEFIRYCNTRVIEFEINTVDEFLSKSYDELTLLFNDTNEGRKGGFAEDDTGLLYDPDVEALVANSDGTGKVSKNHLPELLKLIADASTGRFNERFYYFYSYLTHWVDEKKAPFIDQDFLFCIDASRVKEIANDALLQSKVRYILETYFEGNLTASTFTCRLDVPNAELQTRIVRSLQKYLTSNVSDFSALEDARTNLVRDKLVLYYAGFKAYLFRMNLTKTHPSRLARLQEQLDQYQEQQRQQASKSAKTVTRSSASTNKNSVSRKNVTVMSKTHPVPSTTSYDITKVTKTQRILEERTKNFEKLPSHKIDDVNFPNGNKPARQRSATNHGKSRSSNNQEGHIVNIDSLNSFKEKAAKGPVSVQYTLTSGLRIRYSDGRPMEGSASGAGGTGAQQRRISAAYSFASAND